jgi:hypothetical protein
MSVAPSGLKSVSGATITLFDPDDAGLLNQIFNPQKIDFQIPCGMNDNIFMDTRETTLSFKLKIVVGTASVDFCDERCHLISSASRFFDALTLYSILYQ